MQKAMTSAEMVKAYPALCQKCADLQSDLDETRKCIERIKEDNRALERDLQDAAIQIITLKAKL